ncbi:hypothetical protein M8J76_015695 [Diaphorina citri]|nr:hypothetical protein M8J76_015695 [Diaphorina citri]
MYPTGAGGGGGGMWHGGEELYRYYEDFHNHQQQQQRREMVAKTGGGGGGRCRDICCQQYVETQRYSLNPPPPSSSSFRFPSRAQYPLNIPTSYLDSPFSKKEVPFENFIPKLSPPGINLNQQQQQQQQQHHHHQQFYMSSTSPKSALKIASQYPTYSSRESARIRPPPPYYLSPQEVAKSNMYNPLYSNSMSLRNTPDARRSKWEPCSYNEYSRQVPYPTSNNIPPISQYNPTHLYPQYSPSYALQPPPVLNGANYPMPTYDCTYTKPPVAAPLVSVSAAPVTTGTESNVQTKKPPDKKLDIDVREYLATWDDSDDETSNLKPPETEPIVVLDCTSLAEDGLAQVREKLKGRSVQVVPSNLGDKIPYDIGIGSATIVQVQNSDITPNQDSIKSHQPLDFTKSMSENPVKEPPKKEFEALVSYYGDEKKDVECNYDLVEITERFVHATDKICNPAKDLPHDKLTEKPEKPAMNLMEDPEQYIMPTIINKSDYNKATSVPVDSEEFCNKPRAVSDNCNKPVNVQEFCSKSVTTPEFSRKPDTTQEFCNTPVTTPEFSSKPIVTSDYCNKPPVPSTDFPDKSVITPEFCSKTSTSPGFCNKPITAQEFCSKPVTAPEFCSKPVTTPEFCNKPVSAPEFCNKPVNTPEFCNKPVTAPEFCSKPVLTSGYCNKAITPEFLNKRVAVDTPEFCRKVVDAQDYCNKPPSHEVDTSQYFKKRKWYHSYCNDNQETPVPSSVQYTEPNYFFDKRFESSCPPVPCLWESTSSDVKAPHFKSSDLNLAGNDFSPHKTTYPQDEDNLKTFTKEYLVEHDKVLTQNVQISPIKGNPLMSSSVSYTQIVENGILKNAPVEDNNLVSEDKRTTICDSDYNICRNPVTKVEKIRDENKNSFDPLLSSARRSSYNTDELEKKSALETCETDESPGDYISDEIGKDDDNLSFFCESSFDGDAMNDLKDPHDILPNKPSVQPLDVLPINPVNSSSPEKSKKSKEIKKISQEKKESISKMRDFRKKKITTDLKEVKPEVKEVEIRKPIKITVQKTKIRIKSKENQIKYKTQFKLKACKENGENDLKDTKKVIISASKKRNDNNASVVNKESGKFEKKAKLLKKKQPPVREETTCEKLRKCKFKLMKQCVTEIPSIQKPTSSKVYDFTESDDDRKQIVLNKITEKSLKETTTAPNKLTKNSAQERTPSQMLNIELDEICDSSKLASSAEHLISIKSEIVSVSSSVCPSISSDDSRSNTFFTNEKPLEDNEEDTKYCGTVPSTFSLLALDGPRQKFNTPRPFENPAEPNQKSKLNYYESQKLSKNFQLVEENLRRLHGESSSQNSTYISNKMDTWTSGKSNFERTDFRNVNTLFCNNSSKPVHQHQEPNESSVLPDQNNRDFKKVFEGTNPNCMFSNSYFEQNILHNSDNFHRTPDKIQSDSLSVKVNPRELITNHKPQETTNGLHSDYTQKYNDVPQTIQEILPNDRRDNEYGGYIWNTLDQNPFLKADSNMIYYNNLHKVDSPIGIRASFSDMQYPNQMDLHGDVKSDLNKTQVQEISGSQGVSTAPEKQVVCKYSSKDECVMEVKCFDVDKAASSKEISISQTVNKCVNLQSKILQMKREYLQLREPGLILNEPKEITHKTSPDTEKISQIKTFSEENSLKIDSVQNDLNGTQSLDNTVCNYLINPKNEACFENFDGNDKPSEHYLDYFVSDCLSTEDKSLTVSCITSKTENDEELSVEEKKMCEITCSIKCANDKFNFIETNKFEAQDENNLRTQGNSENVMKCRGNLDLIEISEDKKMCDGNGNETSGPQEESQSNTPENISESGNELFEHTKSHSSPLTKESSSLQSKLENNYGHENSNDKTKSVTDDVVDSNVIINYKESCALEPRFEITNLDNPSISKLSDTVGSDLPSSSNTESVTSFSDRCSSTEKESSPENGIEILNLNSLSPELKENKDTLPKASSCEVVKSSDTNDLCDREGILSGSQLEKGKVTLSGITCFNDTQDASEKSTSQVTFDPDEHLKYPHEMINHESHKGACEKSIASDSNMTKNEECFKSQKIDKSESIMEKTSSDATTISTTDKEDIITEDTLNLTLDKNSDQITNSPSYSEDIAKLQDLNTHLIMSDNIPQGIKTDSPLSNSSNKMFDSFEKSSTTEYNVVQKLDKVCSFESESCFEVDGNKKEFLQTFSETKFTNERINTTKTDNIQVKNTEYNQHENTSNSAISLSCTSESDTFDVHFKYRVSKEPLNDVVVHLPTESLSDIELPKTIIDSKEDTSHIEVQDAKIDIQIESSQIEKKLIADKLVCETSESDAKNHTSSETQKSVHHTIENPRHEEVQDKIVTQRESTQEEKELLADKRAFESSEKIATKDVSTTTVSLGIDERPSETQKSVHHTIENPRPEEVQGEIVTQNESPQEEKDLLTNKHAFETSENSVTNEICLETEKSVPHVGENSKHEAQDEIVTKNESSQEEKELLSDQHAFETSENSATNEVCLKTQKIVPHIHENQRHEEVPDKIVTQCESPQEEKELLSDKHAFDTSKKSAVNERSSENQKSVHHTVKNPRHEEVQDKIVTQSESPQEDKELLTDKLAFESSENSVTNEICLETQKSVPHIDENPRHEEVPDEIVTQNESSEELFADNHVCKTSEKSAINERSSETLKSVHHTIEIPRLEEVQDEIVTQNESPEVDKELFADNHVCKTSEKSTINERSSETLKSVHHIIEIPRLEEVQDEIVNQSESPQVEKELFADNHVCETSEKSAINERSSETQISVHHTIENSRHVEVQDEIVNQIESSQAEKELLTDKDMCSIPKNSTINEICSDIQNSVHSTNENEAQSSQTPISNDDCENSYSSNVWEDKRLMIRDELYSKSNETGYISEIDDPSNVLGNHHAPAYSSDGGFQAGTTNKGAESIIRNEKVEKESKLKIPQRKICLDVIDQESHSFCQLSGSSKITTAVNVYDYICVNLDKEREQLGYDMNYAHECNTKSPTPQPVARNYVTTVYTYNQVFEQNNVLMKYKPQSRTLFNNEIKQKSWKPSSPSNSKIYNSSQNNIKSPIFHRTHETRSNSDENVHNSNISDSIKHAAEKGKNESTDQVVDKTLKMRVNKSSKIEEKTLPMMSQKGNGHLKQESMTPKVMPLEKNEHKVVLTENGVETNATLRTLNKTKRDLVNIEVIANDQSSIPEANFSSPIQTTQISDASNSGKTIVYDQNTIQKCEGNFEALDDKENEKVTVVRKFSTNNSAPTLVQNNRSLEKKKYSKVDSNSEENDGVVKNASENNQNERNHIKQSLEEQNSSNTFESSNLDASEKSTKKENSNGGNMGKEKIIVLENDLEENDSISTKTSNETNTLIKKNKELEFDVEKQNENINTTPVVHTDKCTYNELDVSQDNVPESNISEGSIMMKDVDSNNEESPSFNQNFEILDHHVSSPNSAIIPEENDSSNSMEDNEVLKPSMEKCTDVVETAVKNLINLVEKRNSKLTDHNIVTHYNKIRATEFPLLEPITEDTSSEKNLIGNDVNCQEAIQHKSSEIYLETINVKLTPEIRNTEGKGTNPSLDHVSTSLHKTNTSEATKVDSQPDLLKTNFQDLSLLTKTHPNEKSSSGNDKTTIQNKNDANKRKQFLKMKSIIRFENLKRQFVSKSLIAPKPKLFNNRKPKASETIGNKFISEVDPFNVILTLPDEKSFNSKEKTQETQIIPESFIPCNSEVLIPELEMKERNVEKHSVSNLNYEGNGEIKEKSSHKNSLTDRTRHHRNNYGPTSSQKISEKSRYPYKNEYTKRDITCYEKHRDVKDHRAEKSWRYEHRYSSQESFEKSHYKHRDKKSYLKTKTDRADTNIISHQKEEIHFNGMKDTSEKCNLEPYENSSAIRDTSNDSRKCASDTNANIMDTFQDRNSNFKSQKVDSKNNANQNKEFTENFSESSSKELCDSAKLPTKDEDATLEKSQMTLSTSSIINLNPIDFELNKKTREFVNPKFSGSPSSDLPEVEEKIFEDEEKIFEDDQDFVVIDSWSDSENESIETNNTSQTLDSVPNVVERVTNDKTESPSKKINHIEESYLEEEKMVSLEDHRTNSQSSEEGHRISEMQVKSNSECNNEMETNMMSSFQPSVESITPSKEDISNPEDIHVSCVKPLNESPLSICHEEKEVSTTKSPVISPDPLQSTEERNIMDVPMISKRSEENESEPKTSANMCSIFIEEERKNCFANENTEALEESDDHVVTKTDANDEKELSRQSDNHKLKYAEPVQEDDVNNSNEPCESIQDVGSNQLTENKIVNERSAVETSNGDVGQKDNNIEAGNKSPYNEQKITSGNVLKSSTPIILHDVCDEQAQPDTVLKTLEDEHGSKTREHFSNQSLHVEVNTREEIPNISSNISEDSTLTIDKSSVSTSIKSCDNQDSEIPDSAENAQNTERSTGKSKNTVDVESNNTARRLNKVSEEEKNSPNSKLSRYKDFIADRKQSRKCPKKGISKADAEIISSLKDCSYGLRDRRVKTIPNENNRRSSLRINSNLKRKQIEDLPGGNEKKSKSTSCKVINHQAKDECLPQKGDLVRSDSSNESSQEMVEENQGPNSEVKHSIGNSNLCTVITNGDTIFIQLKSQNENIAIVDSDCYVLINNDHIANETPLVIVDSSNEDIHIESDTPLNKNCSGSDVTWEKEMSTNNTEPPPTLLPFWNEVKDNKHNVKSIPVLKPEQKSELEENKHMNNAILNCESSLKKKRSAEEKTVEITQMKKCVMHKEEATEILPSEILKSSKLVKKRSSKPNTSIQSKVNNASEEKSCSSTEGDEIHMNNSCVNNEGRDASHTIPGIKSGLRKRSFPKNNSFDPNQQKNRENELESNDGIMYSDCKENMLITPTHSAESISDTSSSMKKSNDTHNHETLEKIEACTNNVRKCLKRIKNKRKLLKSFDEDENMNKIMKIEETTIPETNLISKTFTNNKEEHVTEKCENKSVTKAKRKYYENNNTDQMKNNKIPSKLPITKTTKINCHSHEDKLSRKKEVENEHEKSKAAEISGENGQITSRHKVSNSKVILHKKLSAINTQISVSKVGCDEKIGANKKSLKCISSLKRKLNAFDANFSLFKAEDKDLKSIKRITKKTDRNNTSFPKIVEEKTSSAEISFLQEKNDFTNNEVTGNTVEEQVPVVNKTILEESDEEKLLEEMVSATLKPLDTLCTDKDVEKKEEKYDSSENAFKSLDTRCINKVVRKLVKNHQSSKDNKSNNNNSTLREKGNTTDGHENGKLLQQTVSEEITARQQDTSKDISDESYALVNETVSLVPSISPNNGNNDNIYMESPVSKKIRESLDTKLSVCSDVEIFPSKIEDPFAILIKEVNNELKNAYNYGKKVAVFESTTSALNSVVRNALNLREEIDAPQTPLYNEQGSCEKDVENIVLNAVRNETNRVRELSPFSERMLKANNENPFGAKESNVSFRQDKDFSKKIDHSQWEIRDRTPTKLTPSPTMLGDTETFKCPLSKIAQGRQEKRSPFSCKRTLGLDELSSGLRPPTEADYLSSWKLQCPEKWVGKDSTIRETMNQILDDTIGTVDSNKDMGSIELPGFSEIVSKPPAREESFSSETENPSKIPIFDIEISGQLQKDVTSICQDKMEMTVEKVKECLPCPELKSPSDETYEVNDGGEQKDLSKYSEENSVTMLCENNGSTDMENVMESQYESRTSNSGENISNSGQTLSDQDFDDVPSENTMEASNCELTERLNTLHLNEPQVNLSPKVSHDILTESLPTHINNNGLDVESDEQVAIVEYTETCVEEEGDIVDRPLEISMATCIHGTQEYITRKTEGSEEDEMLTGSILDWPYLEEEVVTQNDQIGRNSPRDLKCKLPWSKIFDFERESNDSDSADSQQRSLELGPVEIKLQLNSFQTSCLKVKRLILQKAHSESSDRDNFEYIRVNQPSIVMRSEDLIEEMIKNQVFCIKLGDIVGCDFCGKQLLSKDFLSRHLRHLHELHTCPVCDQTFSGELLLVAHKSCHKERHHCLLCNKTFSTGTKYRQHEESASHKQLESVQRQTIHILYKYLSGRDCTSLEPLSVQEVSHLKWHPSDSGK